jgi:hypothetical protein
VPGGLAPQGGPPGPFDYTKIRDIVREDTNKLETLVKDQLQSLWQALERTNTINEGVVRNEFMELQESIERTIVAAQQDTVSGQVTLSNLIGNLQNTVGQVQAEQNNVVSVLGAIGTAQVYTGQALSSVDSALQAIKQQDFDTRSEMAQFAARMAGQYQGQNAELSNALAFVGQELDRRDQIQLRQSSELENAVRILQQSQVDNLEELANFIEAGVRAGGMMSVLQANRVIGDTRDQIRRSSQALETQLQRFADMPQGQPNEIQGQNVLAAMNTPPQPASLADTYEAASAMTDLQQRVQGGQGLASLAATSDARDAADAMAQLAGQYQGAAGLTNLAAQRSAQTTDASDAASAMADLQQRFQGAQALAGMPTQMNVLDAAQAMTGLQQQYQGAAGLASMSNQMDTSMEM